MLKRISPVFLAPIPFLLLVAGICIWVFISPEELIDGRADNAPDRAAIILLMLLPIIIYPIMVAGVAIQATIMQFILLPFLGCRAGMMPYPVPSCLGGRVFNCSRPTIGDKRVNIVCP
jgi:hypothetical protein